MNVLEEGTKLTLDFLKLQKVAETKQAVVPVVLQHADTREVLFIGYANELALQETQKTRRAVLWSTSRNELWRKGETSGDVLDLVEIRVNCEQNSLLNCPPDVKVACVIPRTLQGKRESGVTIGPSGW